LVKFRYKLSMMSYITMGVGIYYFYHRFELKAFEGRHIRMPNEQFSAKYWILYHLYKSRKVVLHTQFCRHERPLRLNVLDMSCILWYIMFLPFANLHRWCNIIYKYNLFLPWYSWKLLIWHSNTTSFKRFKDNYAELSLLISHNIIISCKI
jgi:hypothetical protein